MRFRMLASGAIALVGGACGSSDARLAPPTDTTTPLVVDSSGAWRSIQAAAFHTCGLTKANLAYCWGWGSRGELGDGTTANHAAPVAVAGGIQFRTLVVGRYLSCGISAAGDSYCWGFGGYGAVSSPTRVGGTSVYVALAIDDAYLCGLTATGTVYCWSKFGDFREAPTLLSSGVAFTSIIGGVMGPQICGLTADGSSYCWGNYEVLAPMAVVRQPATAPLVSIATNGDGLARPPAHVCGLTREGTASCWGRNAYGELGNGTTTPSDTASNVLGGLHFQAVAARGGTTVGLTPDGHAYVWGNWLGVNSTTPRSLTVRVFSQLSIGWAHACGVTARGAGYCWGSSDYGVFGNGTSSELGLVYTTPVRVSDPVQ